MTLRYIEDDKLESGCDEAGRGCLAGPVVAAAVILPNDFKNELLNDSKQLSLKKRLLLYPIIKKEALAYGIGVVSPQEIDEINILNASFLAMHRAIDQLEKRPDRLLIDGNRFNAYASVEHHCIVKGDAKFMAIAAASVLAKVFRDHLMHEQHLIYPAYHWDQNNGYPTKKHRVAIKEYGPTPLHRKTFKLLAT
ncbi:ribonuclease HII [Putridiphycobacter roseus]|uniref:Ribonuclease HII n=1 Tax=Putridiphycobacter roseus TaxID=2219161 RepID=A0A2W1NTJ3_9FLAO|nr:ribonuclease HII [Putridiphycobacter roseus]